MQKITVNNNYLPFVTLRNITKIINSKKNIYMEIFTCTECNLGLKKTINR